MRGIGHVRSAVAAVGGYVWYRRRWDAPPTAQRSGRGLYALWDLVWLCRPCDVDAVCVGLHGDWFWRLGVRGLPCRRLAYARHALVRAHYHLGVSWSLSGLRSAAYRPFGW